MNKIAWPAVAVGKGMASGDGATNAFPRHLTQQLLRIMKLTGFFILVVCLHTSARGISQSVSLTLENASLQKVFSEIIRQSGTTIVYSDISLKDAKPVTIKVMNATAEQVLNICLKDQPFYYTVADGFIIVKPKSDEEHFSSRLFSPPIKGYVTDEDGKPLTGINITVKGTNTGVITDANGAFSLNADAGATLLVSSVEYESQQYKVEPTQKMFAITLTKKITSLHEVVVNKGYYTERQRNSVSNTTTITSRDIEKQPVSNFITALEGRTPGLFITQGTGVAGGGTAALIQGQNSLHKGSDPFYVIDGVPYVDQLLPNLSNSILGLSGVNGDLPSAGNPLSFLNPSDIESITVLKDADATAIYGSRAANGAILITTKKGKAGQTRIDFDLQSGWGRIARMMKLFNAQQYLQMRHEAIQNDGLTVGPGDFDINGVWDTTKYHDVQKDLIGGTSQYTNLYGSVSGGTANAQYLLGTTYHRETAVYPGKFADQSGAIHFSVNASSENQKFHIQFSANYLTDLNKLPQADFTHDALTLPPISPDFLNKDGSVNWALDSNGRSTWRYWRGNPVAKLLNHYNSKTTNITGNLLLSYEIIKGLKLQSNFGYNNLQSDEIATFPSSEHSPDIRQFYDRSSNFANNNINSWIIEPQLSYNSLLGPGKIEALVGTTIQQKNADGKIVNAIGFNSDELMEDIVSASTLVPLSSSSFVYRYNAIFGRLNYILRDKYILNLTARRDGSSRFGPASQFHNFGSVGGAWIFSDENFVHRIAPGLSLGKIKLSYGTTGSDQIGEYGFLNLFTSTFAEVPYQNATGLAPNGLTNPYFRWEESRKMNAGLDLAIKNERILFTINFYRNRSSNQLISHRLPTLAGFTNITQNFPATVQNTGWEFNLNTINIRKKDFTWTSSFNLTIPKNKLIKYDNLANTSDKVKYKIGLPITLQRVFHLLGVDPQTGVYQFADAQGHPTPTPGDDALSTYVDVSPKLFGGFDNSFTIKGFTLDIFFQFVKRNAQNVLFGDHPGILFNQPAYIISDHWQKPGDHAPVQRYNSDFTWNDQYINVSGYSDAAFSDASFIRLKNVSLSWKIPESWSKNLHLKSADIYVHAQNLLTITHYKGLDPETASYFILPPLRMITAGLKLGL